MIIDNELKMLRFGEHFARHLKLGDVVAINGTLGAGKTVFCRGILKAFGYSGEVSSPSYALVHHYDPPNVHIPVIHADLYRLNSHNELDELGLFECSVDCVTLIEWAERASNISKIASHIITIEMLPSGERILNIVIK